MINYPFDCEIISRATCDLYRNKTNVVRRRYLYQLIDRAAYRFNVAVSDEEKFYYHLRLNKDLAILEIATMQTVTYGCVSVAVTNIKKLLIKYSHYLRDAEIQHTAFKIPTNPYTFKNDSIKILR